jgi:Pyruvate/2-oxoacid:ferredoxin oxidoreductase delta subunit
MTTITMRKIIQIDEEKCTGCGICIDSCAEGALALVNGKARLVKEKYCDGLAACLKECSQGALKIVEKEAEDFDEESARVHLEQQKKAARSASCACAGSAVRKLEKAAITAEPAKGVRQEPMLTHWPVQLALVPPGAKFLEDRDVVLIADCVPFAYPNLHADFLKDRAVLVACPKLDDAEAHLEKLTEILKKSDIKSLTVVHMEVPCCSGLDYIARTAIANSGKTVQIKEVTIGINGDIKESLL